MLDKDGLQWLDIIAKKTYARWNKMQIFNGLCIFLSLKLKIKMYNLNEFDGIGKLYKSNNVTSRIEYQI